MTKTTIGMMGAMMMLVGMGCSASQAEVADASSLEDDLPLYTEEELQARMMQGQYEVAWTDTRERAPSSSKKVTSTTILREKLVKKGRIIVPVFE
jgi:hypothetical protein